MTELHIKNMVCDRCILIAGNLLRDEGYAVKQVTLGRALLGDPLHELNMDRLGWKFRELGFDLIYDRSDQIVAQIKATVLAYLHALEAGGELRKMSVFISDAIDIGYQTLSRTFSEKTDDTIEKYLIRLKVERIKELISYDELNLSEISWKLGYSSVQHISTQFKKVTGQTVREYKESIANGDDARKPLDEL